MELGANPTSSINGNNIYGKTKVLNAYILLIYYSYDLQFYIISCTQKHQNIVKIFIEMIDEWQWTYIYDFLHDFHVQKDTILL